MRRFSLLFALIALPTPAFAQQFDSAHYDTLALLVETTYASSPPPVQDSGGVGDLRGGAARRYRQQLQQQYQQESSAASVEPLLEEEVASPPADVVEEPSGGTDTSDTTRGEDNIIDDSIDNEDIEDDPVVNTDPTPKQQPTPQPVIRVISSPEQEEQDELTLEQLEEYANEAEANAEEQEKLLEDGFVITSTSSLGSPLTTNQRAAILRRNVRTVPQLKMFARALAESDDNLRQIRVEGNKITMSYRQKAKIFGLIPVNYLLETTIEDGKVSVNKRWWHAITKDGIEEFVEEVEDQVLLLEDTELSDVDLSNVLQHQQQTMQMMSNVSKMLHDTGMAIIRKIGG